MCIRAPFESKDIGRCLFFHIDSCAVLLRFFQPRVLRLNQFFRYGVTTRRDPRTATAGFVLYERADYMGAVAKPARVYKPLEILEIKWLDRDSTRGRIEFYNNFQLGSRARPQRIIQYTHLCVQCSA